MVTLVPVRLQGLIIEKNNEKYILSSVEDITERKKIEDLIQAKELAEGLAEGLKTKNEELERANQEIAGADKIFSLSLDLLFIAKGEYFTKINPAFTNTFGYDEKEILDKPFLFFVHPDDVQATLNVVMTLQQDTTAAYFINRFRCKDNSYKWMAWTVSYEAGVSYGVGHDITDRKKAEEEERKHHEQKNILAELGIAVNRVQQLEEIYELALSGLQQIIGTDKSSVLLFDDDNIMRFVASHNLSEEYKKAVDGYSRWAADEKNALPILIQDAAKEPSLQNLLPVITQEGICALGFIPLIHQQQLLGKLMLYFNTVHQFTEEEIQYAQSIANNVAFAIWRNKAELELIKAKEFLEETNSIAKIGSWDFNLITNESSWTLEHYRIFEIEPFLPSHELFSAYRSRIHPDDIERLDKAISEALKYGTAIRYEHRVLLPNNNIKYVMGIGTVYKDNAGNIIGAKGTNQDITERKKAEEKLISSEKKYRDLFEKTDDAVLIIENGLFVDCNDAAVKMLKYSREDLLNTPPSKLSPEKQPDGMLSFEKADMMMQIAYKKGSHRFEWDHQKANGEVFPVEVLLTAIQLDEEKKILHTVWRDITERKKADKEKQQLFSLIETSQELIAFGNLDGNPTFINKAGRKLLGVDENEDLSNYHFSDFFHPDDKHKISEEYTPAFIEKGSWEGDTNLLNIKTNDKIAVYMSAFVIRDNVTGKAIGLGNVCLDIAERKRIEKDLIQAKEQAEKLAEGLQIKYEELESANQEIAGADKFFSLSLDMMGIGKGEYFTKVNPSFTSVLGYNEKELFDKPFLSFVHPDDMRAALAEMVKLQQGIPIIHSVIRYRCKDNSYRSLEWTVSPPDTQTGLHYAVARDITDIKKIQNELIQAKEHAEKLVGFKDQFLANMSHEIRTPLNGIIGFTKILLRNGVTEKQKEQLSAIKTSSDILLVVINDILDLAKIEAGKMTLETTELKLPDLVNSLLSTFELRIEEKELTLNKQYDNRIPQIVLGDPIRINQILLNLLSNAVKFTHQGGQISIGTNLQGHPPKKGGLVSIEFIISDTGIGIPADKLATIFEPFLQSGSDTARIYGGTGLGLSIVKRLVDLMDGTIAVKSKLNEGSTFTVTLPLQKTTATEVSKERESIMLTGDLKQLGKLKILLAEDIPVNQLLAQTILHDFGFESDTAENGKIAIELLEKNNYDLILMDLQMPEMNGWEATKHIRSKMQPPKSTIPIIALTADVTKRDVDKCTEVGMDDYVSKPINETELLSKIVRLVKERSDSNFSKVSNFGKVSPEEISPEKVKICNLDYLKSHSPNNPKFLKEMIPMLLKQTPVIIEEINKCLITADWNGLHGNVHKMKPSLDLIGLPKDIKDAALQMEEYAREQKHVDLIPALLLKLEKALEQAYKELEEELRNADE